ncbi:hypothetical protein FB545_1238 [Peribacillus frigoritolerans]|nr:hypothetical protein FB545_1238 [Peribacillus frigoritolerans]
MKYDRFLLCYIGGIILTHQLKKLIVPKNEKMSQNLINNCGGLTFRYGVIKNLSLMGMRFYLRDARLLREMRVQGRPRRREASRRLTDRPRKASAWSGNQRFKFYTPSKKV